jgi:fatty acid desaturase
MYIYVYIYICNTYIQAYYYGGPWIMLGWWLVAVTYLQHHNPDTVVYDDEDWKFVDSGMYMNIYVHI